MLPLLLLSHTNSSTADFTHRTIVAIGRRFGVLRQHIRIRPIKFKSQQGHRHPWPGFPTEQNWPCCQGGMDALTFSPVN